MNPFTASYNTLVEKFKELEIPTDNPGFCDHPAFLTTEQINPDFLNWYAAYVAKRPYDLAYLTNTRKTVANVVRLLHAELLKNGRLGACIDISGILSRILDKEGIWNCGVKGSLTINFPKNANISPRHFWSVDHGNFVAGHAWVFAPPFTVIDISVRQQPYKGREIKYLPEIVLSDDIKQVLVHIDDVVSPSARMEMLAYGVPPNQHLYQAAKYIPHIFSSIPAISAPGLHGTKLKYTPVAIHAPDSLLEEMNNMSFDGLTPWELYTGRIAKAILSNGAQQ